MASVSAAARSSNSVAARNRQDTRSSSVAVTISVPRRSAASAATSASPAFSAARNNARSAVPRRLPRSAHSA